jgi:hypothetical protein
VEKPRTPALCVICDRYRLIYLLIPKNASSTLRQIFGNPDYGGYELRYREVDKRVRDEYLTFAVLREPVARLLSAYQEISYRYDIGLLQNLRKDFFSMDDSPERFAAFLDSLQPPFWDNHMTPQVKFLQDVRVDLFGCVKQLQSHTSILFDRLGMGPCPMLPVRRSRRERKREYGYDRFLMDKQGISEKAMSLIRKIYDNDISLYNRLFQVKYEENKI